MWFFPATGFCHTASQIPAAGRIFCRPRELHCGGAARILRDSTVHTTGFQPLYRHITADHPVCLLLSLRAKQRYLPS